MSSLSFFSRVVRNRIALAALLAAAGGLLAPLRGTSAPDPAQLGQWSGVLSWPVLPVHIGLMPTGKVIMWGSNYTSRLTSDVRIWDPATGQFVGRVPLTTTNLFCAGHSGRSWHPIPTRE